MRRAAGVRPRIHLLIEGLPRVVKDRNSGVVLAKAQIESHLQRTHPCGREANATTKNVIPLQLIGCRAQGIAVTSHQMPVDEGFLRARLLCRRKLSDDGGSRDQ
jgi:hypothetical protein